MDKKVMVAGHICLDIVPRFPETLKGDFSQIFVPGKLLNVGKAAFCTGGAVSNTGLAMAKLGMDVLLNSKVGDDQFGLIIKELIGQERATAIKTVKNEGSSYTVILALPGVDRILLHNPGTNDTFSAEDVDYQAAEGCVLFHFGYPPLMKKMYENEGAQLVDVFKRIKKLGLTTSLDMSLPDPTSESGRVNWSRILEKLLEYIDIFVPSIEEITFMLNRPLFEKRKAQAGYGDPVFAYTPKDYTAISDKLLEMGVKIISLKSGIRGYYLRTAGIDKIKQLGRAAPAEAALWANREFWAPSYVAEEFSSATGAGDATIAGFLCALIRGFSPGDSLQIANAVGWQNVRAIDALSGIEGWKTTLKLFKDKTRSHNSPELKPGGWRYDKSLGIYRGLKDAEGKK
jgi:sugar/nucleoside kinase (ribokinase family)